MLLLLIVAIPMMLECSALVSSVMCISYFALLHMLKHDIAIKLANCTNGQLRLIGGSSENEGRVEICYENQWGTVCNNGWNAEDARVVCRQLGFQTLGKQFN